MGLFRWISTKRELDELRTELLLLKSHVAQMQQEWDATSARVSKTLRRIKRAEQAQDQADAATDDNGNAVLPLTTVGTPPDRMTRIREQLAARGSRKEE